MKKLILLLLILTPIAAFGFVQQHHTSILAQYNAAGGAPANPTFSSATINDTTLVINWNVACTQGTGYNDNQLDLDGLTAGDNIAVTYVSGDGTSQWTYTAASGASNGDTVDLDFDGTANSIENSIGVDLGALTSESVTNNTPGDCTTIQQQQSTASYTTSAWAKSGDLYIASKIISYGGSTGVGICAIAVHGEEIGTATQTGEFILRGDDSGNNAPNDTVYSSSTASFNLSDFPASGSPDYVESAATISNTPTNGNVYWIVLKASGVDASNYIEHSWANESGGRIMYSATGTAGSWSQRWADRTMTYQLKSQ